MDDGLSDRETGNGDFRHRRGPLAPLGRMVMWSHVSEFLRFADDDIVSLGAEERAGGQLDLHGADYLYEFRLDDGLPVWIYKVRDLVIEKRILLPHLQNTF